jgi:hypothetical protein
MLRWIILIEANRWTPDGCVLLSKFFTSKIQTLVGNAKKRRLILKSYKSMCFAHCEE